MSLRINGINDPLPYDEAVDMVGMLVSLRRAVPADRWVQDLIDARAASTIMGGL